jgi:hypothetical protein
MNRCMPAHSRPLKAIFLIAITAVSICASALFSTNSQAQTRNFPATVTRGFLEVGVPPAVLLDGTANQLSPGARIHGTNNMLLLSGSLAGQQQWVLYTRDIGGQLSEVWLLTDAEMALDWPGTKPKRFFFF